MLLSNILSQRKLNYLLLSLLALAISSFTILPLLKTGASGVFFAIDPDVVYVANALSYIKQGQIHYFDHPGTLAIILISHTLLPLRLLAKFVFNTPFVTWAMINYDSLFLYERLFQNFLLWVSTTILFVSIFKFSRTFASVLFAIGALISFSAFPYLGISISSETTSFFLISLWLFALTEFVRSVRTKQFFAMCVIAGLAFGNRATNIFLIPATLILPLVCNTSKVTSKIKSFSLGILLSLLGMVLSIWSIRDKMVLIVKRLFLFAGATQIHGEGKRAIFDSSSYLESLSVIIGREDLATLIIFFTFIGIIAYLAKGEKKERPLYIIGLIFFLGFLAFAKFPLSHYQLANYTVYVFIASYLFSKFPTNLKLAILGLLLILVFPRLLNYQRIVGGEISKSLALESFQKSYPARYATVWEWARSKNFALIWSRDWGGGLFSEEIRNEKPDLLELKTGFEKIKLASGEEVDVFDACWDHLYIQNESLNAFLEKYPNKKLVIIPVEGSGNINLIKSDHCSSTKL